MNSHQRSRFSGILKEIEAGGDQETAGGDPLWEKLEEVWVSYLAADRNKYKKLVDDMLLMEL
jgi:hypothetical protein